MNAALMERLRQISPEEAYYRSHPGRVRQELYTSDQPEEIDQRKAHHRSPAQPVCRVSRTPTQLCRDDVCLPRHDHSLD